MGYIILWRFFKYFIYFNLNDIQMSRGLPEYYDIPNFSGVSQERKKEKELAWLSQKYLDYAKYESRPGAAHQRLSKAPPKGFDEFMDAETDADEQKILEKSVEKIIEYKRIILGKPTKSAASTRPRSRSSSPNTKSRGQNGGKSRKYKKAPGKRKKRRVRKTRRC
jgi:hypothetical protein